jgi:hypothetical protein
MTDIPGNVVIIDAGNNLIKAKSTTSEVDYVHALHALTETEYQQILTRAGKGVPDDYIRVNGQPYAVGTRAERHGALTRLTGTARYKTDYYGVFVAASLFRLYRKTLEVALFASHPSGDVEYRDHLMRAAWGKWEVEHGTDTYCFDVSYVNTFDEPVGGLMNVILTADGRHYQKPEINGGRALVVDIGGGTTDLQGVEPGGALDYALSESIQLGIQQVEHDFERSFRSHHRDELKGMKSMDMQQMRDAITSGVWKGGGQQIECPEEVKEATQTLLNRISEAYMNIAGGPFRYDHIILTGGGSAMLYNYLLPILNHKSVIMAEIPSKMHLANVRGGRKLWKFYEVEGLL